MNKKLFWLIIIALAIALVWEGHKFAKALGVSLVDGIKAKLENLLNFVTAMLNPINWFKLAFEIGKLFGRLFTGFSWNDSYNRFYIRYNEILSGGFGGAFDFNDGTFSYDAP